jgi:tetratricopeptide (TPR) repeat protein
MIVDTLTPSDEDNRNALESAVARFSALTAAHPHDPRWFYSLGDALAKLNRHDEAIAAFRVCASVTGWDEEGAWAMYRAAESYCKLGRPTDAVEACAIGIAKHAGLAELPWLAAFASWEADRPAQAVYWARLSIAMGHFAGADASVPRTGFHHPPALWEAPYDVLRFALRATGDDASADEAERLFHQAKAAREKERGPALLLDQTDAMPAFDEEL